ncbi:MAG TPA: lactate utilization protein C [Phycisphaerae bacterium]|jgi:L-lactate utilization protein LutC
MNEVAAKRVSADTFMRRVREALGRVETPATVEPTPMVDESLVRLADPNDDLRTLFSRRAVDVGIQVHDTTAARLIDSVSEVLGRLGVRSIVASLDAAPYAPDLMQRLQRDGIDAIAWQSAPGFEAYYRADAGLTRVEAALAESGTLVCSAGPEHGRGLSLVPPIHIAIVHRSEIVPDMIDYWTRIDPCDLPSSVVFIAGPSKTADIEGILITGVHGPREVHVVLVADV